MAEWKGTTFGDTGLHNALIMAIRLIDVRLIYAFACIFVVPICLLINTNRSRTLTYNLYRKRFGYGSWKAARNVYLNHCLFSQCVIDKFAMYAGKKFRITIDKYDEFLTREAKPEGFLQLSAHIGNYEIAGYSLVVEHKTMNALIFAGEKESVIENRRKMFSSTHIRMIPVRQDMSHLFLINEALQRGEIVSTPADRINGSPRYIEEEFLGAKARFAQGPFSIAAMRGLDVLAVNVMKEGLKHYHIFVTPLSYDKTAPRKEQIRQLSKAYVSELEDKIRKYPHQWYNYFEFWTQEDQQKNFFDQ